MYKRLKKDSKWSILHLGKFNIDLIKEEVIKYDSEWFLDTSRQELGSVHKDTNMYRICATDYQWEPGTPINTEYHYSLKSKEAKKQLQDIFNYLEEYYSGKVVRCEFIKMKKRSKIYKHIDGGPLLHYGRRVHIPLITDKDITFTVQDYTIHMEEGNWYEINNQMPHSVDNPTDIERVHIIIDILPDDMLYLREKEQ